MNRIHFSCYTPSAQIPLDRWVVFYPRRAADQAEELVSTFGKVAGPMGLRLARPVCVELRDDRTETYVKTIQSQLSSEVQNISSFTASHTNLRRVFRRVLPRRRPYGRVIRFINIHTRTVHGSD